MYSEIKSRIATAKAAFNNNTMTLFTSKTNLNLKKKLAKCYIWSTAVHGIEIVQASESKISNTWEVLKCSAGEGRRRSFGPIM